MNLAALKTEVLAHGFDSVQYGTRIVAYLNDAINNIAREVDYYGSETVDLVTTASGTATFPLPADFARERSLSYTDRAGELRAVYLRDIDRGNPTAMGIPSVYAIDGQTIHLYPTPDASTYVLRLRYWKMPAQLVADTDVPSIPADYHNLLWYWACKECFASEDDPATSQYWEQQFNTGLAKFKADQKFPIGDLAITQVRSMWDSGRDLNPGWSMGSDYD